MVYSEHIDVTDDFGDGFVNALRVETVDKTYFAAESAERRGGVLTTFNNGVYTACEPCEEKPDKAPIWRHQGEEDHLEQQGQDDPLRELALRVLRPAARRVARRCEIADPTVKRKIGFLFPGVTFIKRPRHGRFGALLFRPVADLRPDGHAAPATPSRASSARPSGASASTTANTA